MEMRIFSLRSPHLSQVSIEPLWNGNLLVFTASLGILCGLNRTIVEWKSLSQHGGEACARSVSIEPLWNGNSLINAISHSIEPIVSIEPLWNGNPLSPIQALSGDLSVSIEPLWNGNLIKGMSFKVGILVSIEPLWNGNLSF